MFTYRLVRFALDGGDYHPLMGSGGERVVALFISEIFSVGTGGRYVRRRFRRGALRALPDQGDVAFYAECTPLQHMRCRQADRVDAGSKGHKGDQEHTGSVRARTRTEVRGSKSSFRVCGGAVALMLELISCFSSLSGHAPLSSYRSGKSVRVVREGRALRAPRSLWRSPVEISMRLPGPRCVLELSLIHI